MADQNNRLMLVWSTLAGAVGGAAVTFLLLGTPVVAEEAAKPGSNVLSAQEFRLVDKDGKPRAVLAFSAEGDPYLALLDNSETQRVWLGISSNPGFAIKDNKEGKTRALLSLDDATGQPSLVMRNRQHQVSAVQPKEQ
jgi:hypothetical protein